MLPAAQSAGRKFWFPVLTKAADGGIKLIGTQDTGTYASDLLVLQEGGEPQIMVVCGETLAPLRISLQPVPALTLGPPTELRDIAQAGPAQLTLATGRFL